MRKSIISVQIMLCWVMKTLESHTDENDILCPAGEAALSQPAAPPHFLTHSSNLSLCQHVVPCQDRYGFPRTEGRLLDIILHSLTLPKWPYRKLRVLELVETRTLKTATQSLAILQGPWQSSTRGSNRGDSTSLRCSSEDQEKPRNADTHPSLQRCLPDQVLSEL